MRTWQFATYTFGPAQSFNFSKLKVNETELQGQPLGIDTKLRPDLTRCFKNSTKNWCSVASWVVEICAWSTIWNFFDLMRPQQFFWQYHENSCWILALFVSEVVKAVWGQKVSNSGSSKNFHYSRSHWASVFSRFVKTSSQARSLLCINS